MSKRSGGTKHGKVFTHRVPEGWRYSVTSMWCPGCADYVHIKVNYYAKEQHCKACRSVTLNCKPFQGSKP